MVKKDHLKIFLVFVFSSVLFLSAQSQTRKYFIITGTIISDSQPLENSFVQIKKQNNDSLVFPLQGNGRFRLELNYNSDYTLTFTQKGFLPKSIVVNTKLPEEVLSQSTNLPPFIMAVKLNKENQESESLYSEKSPMQIAYSETAKEFIKVNTSSQYVDKGITGMIQQAENKSVLEAYKTY